MFLKRLETIGFKSFAERIQMDFVPGVTAIVGPNGSGKSNIIDAVRWVLGEQSAKSLRGQKMEDIIFQGSETRNQLNFAEVTLILNNEAGQLLIDYQEVNVTRRVYRSGESEFLINNQTCRLKDIVDLFMDTGLGRESFSIIGQGKIDEILSSKADERRAVFEEAAGVLKYKQRKIKAEYKLVETADNLDRVEDIIHEIEQQIDPLKKQAEIAIDYKKKKQALEQVEVALLVTEIDARHKEWKALLAELEHDKDKEIKQKTTIQKKDMEIESHRQTIQVLDESIADLQQKLLQLTELLEQTEGKRNVWEERSHHMGENKQKLEAQQLDEEERLNQVEIQKQKEEAALQVVETEMKDSVKEMETLSHSLSFSIEDIRANIENKKSDYIEYLNQQAVAQNEKQSLKNELEQFAYKQNKQTVKHQELLDKKKLSDVQQTESAKRIEKESAQLKSLEKSLAADNVNLKKARKTYDHLQQKLYEDQEQVAKLTSRKEMLTEMRDAFQGYFYGVKEILKAKKQGSLTEVEGAVVDLLDVPTTYMTAIDTVLGAQSQFIVVKNDQIAARIIGWLKKENKGRATFLPLQSISAKQIPTSIQDKLNTQEGFIGIAADLIHSSDAYKKIKQHLLGNVIVAKDLKSANQLATLTNRRYRIVTLEGDLVYPGGSISGGAKKKNNQSLFTREKEVQILTEKITDYRARVVTFEKKVLKEKVNLEEIERSITKLEGLIQEQKVIVEELKEGHHDLVHAYRTVSNELSTYEYTKKEQGIHQQQLKDQLEQNAKEQQGLQHTLLDLEKQIEMFTKEEAAFQENEKEMEQQLHVLDVKKAELEERKRNHQHQLQIIQQQYAELKQKNEDTQSQRKKMMDEQELQALKSQLEKEIETYRDNRETASAHLEQQRQQRIDLKQVTEDEEKEVKGLQLELDKFMKTIQEKEVQANRLDVTLENSLNTLQTTYTMTYEKAANLYEKVSDMEMASDDVKRIKQEIKQLGIVNLGAIDEYKRLSERYTFLQEQQDDLIQAKATLYEVIKEMDEELITRFSAVFKDIQTAFTRVFTEVFDGGYAALQLTDPDNLLETGIDIIARPPGKKLKTLGLLSGGERALTAIALLFAILEVRPVPFCILDEVDAALDEANVRRFGAYLQSFSNQTQFVVITHRKGTMEEADALYGITMQESGVSRLVSVKLEDTNTLAKST